MEIVDEATFAKAYQTLSGRTDVPGAFQAFDDLIYIRRGSATPLGDVVHEGTHVLQKFGGVSGSRLKLEVQAHLQEKFFRKAIGLPSRYSTESLEQSIKLRYPNWMDKL